MCDRFENFTNKKDCSNQYSLGKVYLSEVEIKEKIQAAAEKINKDFAGRKPLIVGILTGSIFFLTEFLKHLKICYEIDFMAVSNYEGKKTQKNLRFFKKSKYVFEGRDVIIVEDALDTGITYDFLQKTVSAQRPKSFLFLFLIQLERDKKERIFPKNVFCLFKLKTKKWLVGFGLDYNDKFRGLQDIHELIEPDEE